MVGWNGIEEVFFLFEGKKIIARKDDDDLRYLVMYCRVELRSSIWVEVMKGSSLTRQLALARAQNATNSTHRVIGKTRPSVLFENHEAADYDRDTIHALGVSGLNELISSNNASELEKFREALFGAAVARSERDLQTKEINEELNGTLNEFILLLSAYFPAKAAVKVLEYLVRHFSVQIHNVEALVLSILPSHDSNFFVRVVTLPVMVKNTKWAFLRRMQRTREPIARNQLVKVCLSETSILQAVGDLVIKQPRNSRFTSFFAVLYCETVRKAREQGKEENLVPIMLKPTSQALRAGFESSELQLAGYMIATHLARFTALSNKAGTLLIMSCLRKAALVNLSQAYQCAATIWRHQEKGFRIPESSVGKICKYFELDDVGNALRVAFGAKCDPEDPNSAFVLDLYLRLASAFSEESLQLLDAAVRKCMPCEAASVFRELARSPAKASKEKSIQQSIARFLAAHAPHAIDAIVSEGEEGVVQFAMNCFSGDDKVVTGAELIQVNAQTMTLRAALHHHVPSVRKAALESLKEKAKYLQEGMLDTKALCDVVCDADEDEDSAILALQILSDGPVLAASLKKDEVLHLVEAVASRLNVSQEFSSELLRFCGGASFPCHDDSFFVTMVAMLLDLKETEFSARLNCIEKLASRYQAEKVFSDLSSLKLKLKTRSELNIVHRVCDELMKRSCMDGCVDFACFLAEQAVPEFLVMACKLAMHSVRSRNVTNVLATILKNKQLEEVSAEELLSDRIPSPPALEILFLLLDLSIDEEFGTYCSPAVQELLGHFFTGKNTFLVLLLISAGAVRGENQTMQRRALVLVAAFVRAFGEDFSFDSAAPYLVHSLLSLESPVLRVTACDCAEAILQSARTGEDFLKSKPGPSKGATTRSKAATRGRKKKNDSELRSFVPFLEGVCNAQPEFAVDSNTLLRVTSNLKDVQPLIVLIEEAAELISQSSDSQTTGTENRYSVSKVAHGMLKPIWNLKGDHAVFFCDACSELAHAALKRSDTEVLSHLMSKWSECTSDLPESHIRVIVTGLESNQNESLLLNPLRNEAIFKRLSRGHQEKVFDAICAAVASSQMDPSVFAGIAFDGDLLLRKLEKDPNRLVLEAARSQLHAHLDKKHLENLASVLLPCLFSILRKHQDLMVLAALQRCLQILEFKHGKRVDEALMAIDLEVIVGTILRAASPAIRSSALEVLAICTRIFPQKTVKVVLPVLKQVQGTKVNSEAFLVLEYVAKCLSAMNAKILDDGLVKVLKDFVGVALMLKGSAKQLDALELVVRSVGKSVGLWSVVTMLLLLPRLDAKKDVDVHISLCMTLLSRFKLQDQVFALVRILYMATVLGPLQNDDDLELVSENGEGDSEFEIMKNGLDYGSLDSKSLMASVEAIIKLVRDQLSSKGLLRQLQATSTSEIERQGLHGKQGFLGLLNVLHRQIHDNGAVVENGKVDDIDRYRKLRNELCLVMDRITALLSVPVFVVVLQELLNDEDAYVRHLGIRQLSAKVEQQHSRWSREERLLLLEMVSDLRDLIAKKEECEMNKQTALLSIDILAKTLADQHPSAFVDVLGVIVEDLQILVREVVERQAKIERIQLCSSSSLCAATLIHALGENALKYLPALAEYLIRCLKYSLQDGNDELLVQSVATAIYALSTRLPKFLSPYTMDLLFLAGEGAKSSARVVCTRIGEDISKTLEPRLLLAPMEKLFLQFLEEHHFDGALSIVKNVHILFKRITRGELVSELDNISHLLAHTLELRSVVFSGCEDLCPKSMDELDPKLLEIEKAIANAFTTMALMLSGTQMSKLFDVLIKDNSLESSFDRIGEHITSSVAEIEDGGALVDAKKDWHRQCKAAVLYLFTAELGDQLLVLSLPFLQKVLPNILFDLQNRCGDSSSDEPSEMKRLKRNKSREVWESSWRLQQRTVCLRALRVIGLFCEQCGEAGQMEFMKILDAVLFPLDIDTHLVGDEKEAEIFFSSMVAGSLGPTVVRLGRSVSNDALWQSLIKGVLEYSHHASALVRVATLKVLVALFEGMGDSFVVLIADCLPSVAEMLEDPEHTVKVEANRTVKKLQQLSGEDLTELLT